MPSIMEELVWFIDAYEVFLWLIFDILLIRGTYLINLF